MNGLEDIFERIKILNDMSISNEQFLLCKYIEYAKSDTLKKKFTNEFELYVKNNEKCINFGALLQDLERRGFIINTGSDSKKFNFQDIVLTDKLDNSMFIDEDTCWEEVRAIYPLQMYLHGKDKWIPAQTSSNRELKTDYFKLVTGGGDKSKHLEFIELTAYYYQESIKNNTRKTDRDGSMGLSKWIYSWDSLKEVILLEATDKDNTSAAKVKRKIET
jgi:hypothetical protein